MPYDQYPNCKTIRLTQYDYSQCGYYFVTVCSQGRECVFGEIKNDVMYENERARIVREEWLRTADVRSNVLLDEFVIMPNHIHGIISIDGRGDPMGRPTSGFSTFNFHLVERV